MVAELSNYSGVRREHMDAGESGELSQASRERVEAVQRQMVPDAVFADLAETFQAMGDRTRVKLLFALSRAELCVGELAALLGVTASAVSHQLRLLRSLRLVRSRRDGRWVSTLWMTIISAPSSSRGWSIWSTARERGRREGEESSGDEEPAAAGIATRR